MILESLGTTLNPGPPFFHLRHQFKTIRLLLTIAFLIGAGWLAVFAYDRGFTSKWKNYIIKELEKHGIAAEIERLTIDPVNGLTARNVSFYDLTNRSHHMADISNISLDVDLGKLVDGKDFLRTIDLRRASLTLPVDPDEPEGESVKFRDLNARLHFNGDQVEISRAEGDISGIRVNVHGTIDLPKKPQGTKEDIDKAKRERLRQIQEIKKRRGALHQLVHFLELFKSSGSTKATMDIQVDGPLANIDAVEASMRLHATNLKCGTFEMETLKAELSLSQGLLSLQKFDLTDRHGRLNAQASWAVNSGKAIEFSVDSTVDAHALLKGLWQQQSLGEVVFYQPPHLRADGKILLNDTPTDGFYLPLDVVARFDCRKFTTHGVIFDGFHGDFAVKRNEFYARNVQLDHESGSASGRFMHTTEAGLKYHAKWNMKLGAALPFVDSDAVQQILAAFDFQKDSYVSIEALGAGGGLSPETWTGSVQADLRNFSYRDMAVKAVSADITLADGKCIARNIILQRPEGEVRVVQFNVVPAERIFGIQGLVCTSQPLPLVKAIVPFIAKQVEPYVFNAPPNLKVDGIIYGKDPSKSDLLVQIQANSRASATVGPAKYDVASASGILRWKDDAIALDLTSKGAAGITHSGVTSEREPDMKFNARFGVGKNLGKLSQWLLTAKAADDVKIAFAGKQIPAQSLDVKVVADQGQLTVNGTARVYGGGVAANFDFPDTRTAAPYTSTVRLDRVSYAKLAKLFDPAKNTVGDLSGFLNFTGSGGDTNSIKGAGRIIINDGDVFSIPLLGPLSKLFSTVLPVGRLIYSVAREATADIVVEKGTVSTQKFEAQTGTFKLLVNGMVDYTNDRVDMTARMNLRGAPGLLLFPVSKLFEYEAQGTMGEPNWKPKHLGIPFIGDKNERRRNDNGAAPKPE